MATTRDSGTSEAPVWLDPNTQTFSGLDGSLSTDIVIVGGGITGLACARWLLDVGARNVVLVEARTICSGASGRNAGFVMAVAPENFPPNENPDAIADARLIWRFTAENQRLIEDALAEFELEAEYRRRGSLGLAAYPEEWEWIQSSSRVANEAGLAVQLVPRGDLESSWLRDHYFGGAIYPGNAEIHPAKFVRGLADALSARGVRFLERTRVLELDREGPSFLLRCAAGSIKADSLLIATNAYTSDLLPELTDAIQSKRGQVLATVPLSQTVASRPVYANDGFQYWRQRPDGRLILGGWRDLDLESEVGTEETLNARVQDQLTQAAMGLCGGPVAIDHRWSGIMGFTPDRRPLVGGIPGYDGAVICAGFSGHGLAMAFHSARVAVTQLLGGRTNYDHLFAPARLASRLSPTPSAV